MHSINPPDLSFSKESSSKSHVVDKKAVKANLNKKKKHKTLREEQAYSDMKFRENIIIVEDQEGILKYVCKVCQKNINFARKARSHASKGSLQKK